MMRHSRLLFLALLLLMAAPAPLFARDFMDTRITFSFSDNNLLAGPGETNPNSPSLNFNGGESVNTFFDNYNTKDTGFETLSHIVIYKKLPSYFKNLTTETALVARMGYWEEKKQFKFTDAGSYILLTYDLGSSKSIRKSLQITAFPLSSNRFRLGYSYKLSWAGDYTFPRRTLKSPVPGIKIQWTNSFDKDSGMFLFAGVKTALLQQRLRKKEEGSENYMEQIEEETAYGFLGGLGFKFGGFQIEGGAAFFDKGTFSNPAVKSEPVYFYGFSGQISYAQGLPVGVSIDFSLYKNDPDKISEFFKIEKYTPGKFSFNIAAESSYVINLLENPDEYGKIEPAPGLAGDVNFRMKYGYFRLHADVVYRDLGFILKNVPGFVPFQAFSEKQEISPEFFFAIGGDYYFKGSHLTLGLKGGVQFPATFKGGLPKEVAGNIKSESMDGEQIVLIRNEGDFMLLPTKDRHGNAVEVLPVVSFKLNFKWQLSPLLAAVGELRFTVDQNETRLTKDQATGTNYREFVDPIRLGLNFMLQARF